MPTSSASCRANWRAKALWLILCLGTGFSHASDPDEHAALRAHLLATVHQSSSFADRFDAEVWLLSMSTPLTRFIPDPLERLQLLRQIHAHASAAQLDPSLVLAVIEVESSFNRFAISRAGAQGLMQVMPFWKQEIGHSQDNLTEIDVNLRYGCRILQYYLQRERGNWRTALARYNGSYGSDRYPERVMNVWRRHWYRGKL